jgi:hypothetical protein
VIALFAVYAFAPRILDANLKGNRENGGSALISIMFLSDAWSPASWSTVLSGAH